MRGHAVPRKRTGILDQIEHSVPTVGLSVDLTNPSYWSDLALYQSRARVANADSLPDSLTLKTLLFAIITG